MPRPRRAPPREATAPTAGSTRVRAALRRVPVSSSLARKSKLQDGAVPGHRSCKESHMPSFMLLLHRPVERLSQMDPETITKAKREYLDWAERMRAAGRLKGGSKLTDDAGRILRNAGGRVAVTDGPFTESKEMVGGYFLLAAGDYAEACRIAS